MAGSRGVAVRRASRLEAGLGYGSAGRRSDDGRLEAGLGLWQCGRTDGDIGRRGAVAR